LKKKSSADAWKWKWKWEHKLAPEYCFPLPGKYSEIRAIDNVNLLIRETPVTVAHSIVFSGALMCRILISILQYGIRA
jgi:hypothetical protein